MFVQRNTFDKTVADLSCCCLLFFSFLFFFGSVFKPNLGTCTNTQMLREAKKQRGELKKETVDSFHSEFPAGGEGSSQVTGFVECIVLECVVFSVWIKVRVKAEGRAGAWELSNASSIIASVSAAFKINTFTYSTQPAVKKSRLQLYKQPTYTNTHYSS